MFKSSLFSSESEDESAKKSSLFDMPSLDLPKFAPPPKPKSSAKPSPSVPKVPSIKAPKAPSITAPKAPTLKAPSAPKAPSIKAPKTPAKSGGLDAGWGDLDGLLPPAPSPSKKDSADE